MAVQGRPARNWFSGAATKKRAGSRTGSTEGLIEKTVGVVAKEVKREGVKKPCNF